MVAKCESENENEIEYFHFPRPSLIMKTGTHRRPRRNPLCPPAYAKFHPPKLPSPRLPPSPSPQALKHTNHGRKWKYLGLDCQGISEHREIHYSLRITLAWA